MKLILPLLFGLTLTASSFGPPVLAQDAPKNGYETLVAAGKLILPGENGSPSATEKLVPEENLRRQRLAVARNAPALKLLREALKMSVETPIPLKADEANLTLFSSFREMARQLRQESDVRLADGDVAGALDSRLTTFELGVAVTRKAPSLGAFMGIAIESVARQNFEVVAAKLDAPQIRAALLRLKVSDSQRATPAQTWQVEKATVIPVIMAQVQDLFKPEVKKMLATPEGRAEAEMTEAQAQDILALTPETFIAQVSQVFDSFIARDALPYQRALKTKLPTPPSQYVALFVPSWDNANARFSYARNLTAQHLFETALELRIIKLETGAYPPTFAAPVDPFSDEKPLIYQRNDDKYVLYSVGPDGKDDNANPIRTVTTNRRTGLEEVSVRIEANSTGDILAPIF